MAREHPHIIDHADYYCLTPLLFFFFFFFLILPAVLLLLLSFQVLPALAKKPGNVSAVLIFGDSTVDPGNNNYLHTTVVRSNFPPYGRDFPNHEPTGRFSNGKLATDFIASYLGVKDEVPPYLNKSLGVEDLMTGVSFASAGTGFDPLTAETSLLQGVIPVSQQVDNFREYIGRLDALIGKKRREDLMERAVFIVSAGTNDFILNYLTLPLRRHEFDVEGYQRFLLQKVRELLQDLVDLGARRIGVVGLPPMGCLPLVTTFNSEGNSHERGCIEEYQSLTRDYNAKLEAELKDFGSRGVAAVGYCDIYEPAIQLIRSPKQFVTTMVTGNGCCGTGLVELAILCNRKSVVCPDASKYVFWDSVHSTEKTNFIAANAVRPTFLRLIDN